MTTGPLIQNFSVPRGDSTDVQFNVGPDTSGMTLAGSTINWRCFAQEHGIPVEPAVIEKTSSDGIEVLDAVAQVFSVALERADTVDLAFGNYFHQAQITDGASDVVTVTNGIMTITETV